MRPEILFSLFAPITSIPGVGPKIAKLIEVLAGKHVLDVLWHFPTSLIDRRYSPTIGQARTGVIATLSVTIDQHLKPHNRRQPYKIICSDRTGHLNLVFFRAREDYLRRILPEGEEVYLTTLTGTYNSNQACIQDIIISCVKSAKTFS